MELTKYLEEQKKTVSQFSIETGIGERVLYRYIDKTRKPAADKMAIIHKHTNGAVTALDFYK